LLCRIFKSTGADCLCFCPDFISYAAAGHVTYRLNLKNPQDIQPIHGTPLKQYGNGALRIHGRTLSMAYHGDFLFLLHQCMGQKRVIALFVKDGAIRFRGALPEAFRRYSPLLIDPRGNLYLLCEGRTKPMLKFLPGKNVFSRPDRQILLPATYRARFSQDGNLLIILSLDHNEKWTQSLWLWGTKN